MASRRNVGLICFVLVMLLAACGPVLRAAVGSGHGSWVRVTLESGEVVDIWFPDATDANEVAAAVAALEGWAVTVSEDAGSDVPGQSSEVGGYAVVANKKPQDEYDERINSKYEKLNERLNSLINTAVTDGNDLFTEEQKDRMRKGRERVNRGRERVHAAGGLKRMARKHKVKCHIQEYVTSDPNDALYGDGDDDGICEKGEHCLTVQGGACPYQLCGKKKGETCEENCDQESLDSDANNFDGETVDDIEEAFDGMIGAVDDACDTLVKVLAEMPLMRAMSAAAEDECILLPYTEHWTYYSYQKRKDFRLAANMATMYYNEFDSIFNEDALGFNVSIAGAPFAIAAGVLQSLADSYEEYEDQVTAEQVEAACKCLKQTSAQIGDIQEEIAILRAQVEYLTNYVKEKFAEVITLLNTPEGRRPDWPVKDSRSR